MNEMDIRSLVDEFSSALLGAFPDFSFLAPRGQLHLHSDQRPVRRIRATVPATVHCHLHSVEVIVADGPLPLSDARWKTSSNSNEFRPPRDPLAMFDPNGQHRTAFFTEREENPWIEITLPEATQVEKIVLRNTATGMFGRAAGIQVSVCDDSSDPWRVIYDGRERIQSFRKLSQFLIDRLPQEDELTRKLSDALVELSLGNIRAAQDSIAPLGKREKTEFRDSVSTSILARREAEWTVHGLKRSFRFWTLQEKERYIDYSRSVIHDLSEITDNVCFGFGAALAIVRQGDLIPHDDDLDIIVGLEPDQAPTLADGLELIARTLRRRGHTVGGNFLSHRHVNDGNGPAVDVFAGIFEGERINWYPGVRGALTRSTMFPPSVGLMLGQECLLPRSPLPYLEQVYGPTWRVPDTSFRHAWRRNSAYQDIAGVREDQTNMGASQS